MYNPQLETFIRVADAGSFNKAAEESNITPNAVIKQMNLLEGQLGLRLFIRTHRGLTLTEAGESLYEDAKYIIQYSKDAVARAENAMKNRESIIRIGTSPLTPANVLVDLWPEIHPICPNIKIQLVPYENTPENAREILKHLGKNIDIVAGTFDSDLLSYRECAGLKLSEIPMMVAVSIHHRLTEKDRLTMEDLYGETIMVIEAGRMAHSAQLRRDVSLHHPKIHIKDFPFYNIEVFNRCEQSNNVLMAIENWQQVHPLLKILPVDWAYTMPFGLLHSPEPEPHVKQFLEAVTKVINN